MSALDLLNDLAGDRMSEASEWKRMYFKEVARGNTFAQRLFETRMQLTTCESHRSCLMNSLRLACQIIEQESKYYSGTVALMRKHLAEMETEHVPIQSPGTLAGSAPDGPPNETGSGEVPEAATQLEGAQRLQALNCAPIAYTGEWDEVKP